MPLSNEQTDARLRQTSRFDCALLILGLILGSLLLMHLNCKQLEDATQLVEAFATARPHTLGCANLEACRDSAVEFISFPQ